jgi:hypothetical protein
MLNFFNDFIKRNFNKTLIDSDELHELKKQASSFNDKVDIKGIITIGKGKHYECIKDAFGKLIRVPVIDDIVYQGHNIIVIGGNQYVLCKLANLPFTVTNNNHPDPISNIYPGFLQSLGQYNLDQKTRHTPDLSDQNININPLHFINSFSVGFGGSTESNLVAKDVNYDNRVLYQAIPFRYTTAERTTDEMLKYGGVATLDGTTNARAYYLKKFDSDWQIYHRFKDNGDEDGTLASDTIYDTISGNGIDIETYGEVELSINAFEVREYFNSFITQEPPRINEIGLVASYWDNAANDFLDSQLITHLAFPSKVLGSIGQSISKDEFFISYRLYLR